MMSELLSELLVRLSDVKASMVLTHLLECQADVSEYQTTFERIAYDATDEYLTKRQVRLATAKLTKLGLVSTMAHPNTRTYFTVNRDAVLALLAQPLPKRLPGMSDRNFPFLDAWQQARALSLDSQPQADPQSQAASA